LKFIVGSQTDLHRSAGAYGSDDGADKKFFAGGKTLVKRVLVPAYPNEKGVGTEPLHN